MVVMEGGGSGGEKETRNWSMVYPSFGGHCRCCGAEIGAGQIVDAIRALHFDAARWTTRIGLLGDVTIAESEPIAIALSRTVGPFTPFAQFTVCEGDEGEFQ